MNDTRDTQVTCLFHRLTGTWALHRRIISHRPSLPPTIVTGELRISTPATNLWLYEEAGEAAVGPQRLRCRQRYRYTWDAHAGLMRVFFALGERSGRHFHDLHFSRPRGPTWRAWGRHLCGQDHYEAQYAFTFADGELSFWELAHHVHGPDKSYASSTRFTRLTDGPRVVAPKGPSNTSLP